MGDTKFVHNARFVGRKPVDGPLNDFRLSEVVAAFHVDKKLGVGNDEVRCNVEFSDRNLLVTYIKKDEGFESDTESANSVEPKEEKSSSGADEKIIKDHVFRFGESGGEDSYSSNSGGSDSETSDHNKSTSAASSASASPTAELSRYKFDHLETYSISDVLICHTDKVFKNCVIWVIRKSGSLEALVFECLTEDNARQLYRKFHEVSKRSKLERHRRRKSDGGSIVTRASASVDFGKLPVANNGGAKAGNGNGPSVTINNIDTSVIEKAVASTSQKWNLVQHTDKNGVTHIEVESTQLPAHLVKRGGGGGVGGGGGEEPRSLVSFGPTSNNGGGRLAMGGRAMTRNAGKGDKSKFAKELESILSTEIKRRDEANDSSRGQGGNVVLPGSEGEARSSGSSGEGADSVQQPYVRARPPGESLSLRQRAPAMLLRKLDEFEEKAHKIWARAEAEEENRKVWSKGSSSVIGISSPPPKGPQLEHQPNNQKKESVETKEPKTRANGSAKEEKPNSNAIKVKQKGGGAGGGGGDRHGEAINRGKEDSGRMLVPTKTGKEPPRKLYPKESPPIYAAGRFMPVGMPGSMHSLASQPHSLPIYPVQWGNMGRGMGYMDPGAQLDISQSIWRVAPGPFPGAVAGGGGREERSRSRDRTRGGGDEQRRRAQSKSPARRAHQQSGHAAQSRYSMDNVPNLAPDMSGLSRMFREFGAGMKAKMSRPKTPMASSTSMSTDTTDQPGPTKSNLKKREKETEEKSSPTTKGDSGGGGNGDNKKVHFNKFATVQMMA